MSKSKAKPTFQRRRPDPGVGVGIGSPTEFPKSGRCPTPRTEASELATKSYPP
ncbi:MAG: hypothetical protein HY505_02135 [Candidatus Yanofskybacteria bacterium]|nr:hypothetical protein [Candidatus Yanofskybacteria bacterium]